MVRHITRVPLYLASFWLLGFAFYYSQIASPRSPFEVPKAETIVVLTGGAGRIEAGLELLKLGVSPQMFISGVHPSVSSDDLSHRVADVAPLFECCITLGHQAIDTLGNAVETATWVNETNVRSILLISADYHLPRAKALLKNAMPHVAIDIFPVVDQARALTVIDEYHKYLFTLVQLGMGL